MNPRSQFHLSFNLGYPNAYERAQGWTGSALMVHGACASIGCYAMTDAAIEEIYTLVERALIGGQGRVPVHAFPFRMTVAMRENKPQEAIALAREIQKAEPRDPEGFLLEGDVENARRNHDQAVAAYRKALDLRKATDIAMRLHMALLNGGRKAEADKLAADWNRGNPKDAVFRFYEGDVALQRGDLAAAEGHYRAVLATQPRNALAMNNVAYLLVKQGKPGALDLARKANELLPGRPQMMDTLALALATDKKLPEAIEVQKSAISRAPDDPGLKLTLARLLIQSGDKAYARAELEDLAKLGSRFRDQAEVGKLLATL
jgi:Flp pilus assembly protein TadD